MTIVAPALHAAPQADAGSGQVTLPRVLVEVGEGEDALYGIKVRVPRSIQSRMDPVRFQELQEIQDEYGLAKRFPAR